MGYEILTDDLYEDDGGSRKKKKHSVSSLKEDGKKFSFSINPMYIHLVLILIILVGAFYLFMPKIIPEEDLNDKIISIVGELNSFNKNYSGDIELYSNEFNLRTDVGSFDEGSNDFFIKNFNGSILLTENNSIVLNGTALKISFGKNSLNLGGESFILESKLKTRMSLIFPRLDLDFKEGRIMLSDTLNYEFDNSTINLNNYNCSLSYDGIFSFSGTADNFRLDSLEDQLQILYK